MGTSTQLDHTLFRILLYRNDASEILLDATPEGFRLPILSVPADRREAEEITAAIRTSWNLETYGLFRLPASAPAHPLVHDYVVEACHVDTDCPNRMEWLSVDRLSVDAFQRPSDFAAVHNSLGNLNQYRRDELPGAFGKPGWLRTVTEWVEAQAAAAGLHVTGTVRQLNASPTFSLLRFETDGPALWFKAVGQPNLHEHHVTLRLASLFPEFLPRILASRPEWNAWLAVESTGAPLDVNSKTSAWESAAENLALLQISSFGRRFELIQAGCKDLRPHCLMDLVDPFLDAMSKLMARQTKLSPQPLGRDELLVLGPAIVAALLELQDAGVASALGHRDLNPGNVLVGEPHCVFIDWAEAYVGPPFCSFQYLLQHRRRLRREDSHEEVSLVLHYTKIWSRVASPEQIATGFRLAPLLAAFVCAAGDSVWHNPESIPPETAGYLRSIVRRMKFESHALSEGRRVCAL
jgi:hypothetical protein